MIFVLLLLLTGLTIILSLLLGTTGNQPIVMARMVHTLLESGWLAHWHLFSFFWWMSWIPVTGIFIAILSSGYSFRAIILMICLLPTVLGLLTHYNYLQLSTTPTWLAVLIACIGLIIFLAIITPNHTFNSVMLAYLPNNDAIKYRAPDQFLTNIVQFAALMICIYLVAGITILSLLFLVSMLLFSLLLLLLPIRLIIQCL